MLVPANTGTRKAILVVRVSVGGQSIRAIQEAHTDAEVQASGYHILLHNKDTTDSNYSNPDMRVVYWQMILYLIITVLTF